MRNDEGNQSVRQSKNQQRQGQAKRYYALHLLLFLNGDCSYYLHNGERAF